MNISETLEHDLLKQFNSKQKLKNAIEKYEIYRFENINSIQLPKIFDIETPLIFAETNSKKHFNKVLDMIKSYFFNKNTNNYANLLLTPIKDNSQYLKRKKAFLEIIRMKIDENLQKDLKLIISNLTQIHEKVIFNKPIYTLDINSQTLLYENFKLNSYMINKKELEEMINIGNADFILVTSEDLFVEIDTYNYKEFEKIIFGNILKKNSKQISQLINLINLTRNNQPSIIGAVSDLLGIHLDTSLDYEKLEKALLADSSQKFKDMTSRVLRLEEEVENINKELKDVISKKKLSLDGDELLELLNSGNVSALQSKFSQDTKIIITKKEKEIISHFNQAGIKIDFLFSQSTYPLALDSDVKTELLKQIDKKAADSELEAYRLLGSFEYEKIQNLWNYAYLFDFFNGISNFAQKHKLNYPKLENKIVLLDAKNIYLTNPLPISYGIGTNKILDETLAGEKISILTGANSGGKTTILEMFLQAQILTHMGLSIPASEQSSIKFVDQAIYLKKFTGTQGSGAFEQTIRNLIEIIDNNSSKLILIDEFEAITEPGAAAKILIGFLEELSKQDNLCIVVSHLGQEIKEFISEQKISGIRIDGISAQGLDEKANLITNHQPKFNQLGKSTPELILKRVLQDEKFWKGKSEISKQILRKIIE